VALQGGEFQASTFLLRGGGGRGELLAALLEGKKKKSLDLRQSSSSATSGKRGRASYASKSLKKRKKRARSHSGEMKKEGASILPKGKKKATALQLTSRGGASSVNRLEKKPPPKKGRKPLLTPEGRLIDRERRHRSPGKGEGKTLGLVRCSMPCQETEEKGGLLLVLGSSRAPQAGGERHARDQGGREGLSFLLY